MYKTSEEALPTFVNIIKELRSTCGGRDKRGRLELPVIENVSYPPKLADEHLAALHLAYTKKCSQVLASRLADVQASTIGLWIRRTDRIQVVRAARAYDLCTTVEIHDTPELARRALEAGLIQTEEGDLRRALLAARVNPSGWLVALAVHSTDGAIAVMIENIETDNNYPRLFDYRENETDYGLCGRLYKRLTGALDLGFTEKRQTLRLLQYLAPLRTLSSS